MERYSGVKRPALEKARRKRHPSKAKRKRHSASDACPSCGEAAEIMCRCGANHRKCANGHDWMVCGEHGPTAATVPEDGSHPKCSSC